MSVFVFSNLAVSLDGKIATARRGFFPLGTAEDRRQMQVLRRESDVIVMGASTLRTFRKPCLIARSERQPANAVLSSRLEGLSPQWEFFRSRRIRRILFVSPSCPRARMARFRKSCEIVVLRKPTARLPVGLQILQALEARGLRRVLVEGGGGVMWDFVSRDLIDEYHVTLVPRLLGGSDAPTLVDGEGFDPRETLNLKLVQSRVVGDELFLVYRKTGKRG